MYRHAPCPHPPPDQHISACHESQGQGSTKNKGKRLISWHDVCFSKYRTTHKNKNEHNLSSSLHKPSVVGGTFHCAQQYPIQKSAEAFLVWDKSLLSSPLQNCTEYLVHRLWICLSGHAVSQHVLFNSDCELKIRRMKGSCSFNGIFEAPHIPIHPANKVYKNI